MSIEQQNRIIGEFMGGTYPIQSVSDWIYFDPITFADMSGTFGCYIPSLRFDTSWSWLMPVGEKIFNWLQTEVKKRPPHICTEGDLIEVDITCAIREYNKEEAHKHIVRWIEWYNTQNSKPK